MRQLLSHLVLIARGRIKYPISPFLSVAAGTVLLLTSIYMVVAGYQNIPGRRWEGIVFGILFLPLGPIYVVATWKNPGSKSLMK